MIKRQNRYIEFVSPRNEETMTRRKNWRRWKTNQEKKRRKKERKKDSFGVVFFSFFFGLFSNFPSLVSKHSLSLQIIIVNACRRFRKSPFSLWGMNQITCSLSGLEMGRKILKVLIGKIINLGYMLKRFFF